MRLKSCHLDFDFFFLILGFGEIFEDLLELGIDFSFYLFIFISAFRLFCP
jgi:hypothetical protein